jgi:hypothetical protein
MVIKELINKSWYGSIGYVSSQNDLDILERYILFNLRILKEFKNIVVATNYSNLELIENNAAIWKKYFPECILLDSKINRGHNHGNADLDNILFDYCKENQINWLCKSANDIIIESEFLDKEIDEADFYYLNGFGYGGLVPFNFNLEKIMEQAFFPQTNFYFINVSKTDYINDKDYLDETYQKIADIPNYNGKIWEYIDGWACENFLKQCIERNNLLKSHLMSRENYLSLLQIIIDNQIHDCSHKNIMIEGICHLAYPDQSIIKI